MTDVSYPDIWFDLTIPAPVLGFNMFEKLIGLELDPLLGPMLRSQRFDEDGQRYYPLRLPAEDTGFVLQLRTWGALGVKNHRGRLAIFVPPSLQATWESHVGPDVRGRAFPGKINQSPTCAYLMALAPGAATGFELPLVGSIGIRMAPEQPGAKPR